MFLFLDGKNELTHPAGHFFLTKYNINENINNTSILNSYKENTNKNYLYYKQYNPELSNTIIEYYMYQVI